MSRTPGDPRSSRKPPSPLHKESARVLHSGILSQPAQSHNASAPFKFVTHSRAHATMPSRTRENARHAARLLAFSEGFPAPAERLPRGAGTRRRAHTRRAPPEGNSEKSRLSNYTCSGRSPKAPRRPLSAPLPARCVALSLRELSWTRYRCAS